MLEGTSRGVLPIGHRGMSQVQGNKVRVERVRAARADHNVRKNEEDGHLGFYLYGGCFQTHQGGGTP